MEPTLAVEQKIAGLLTIHNGIIKARWFLIFGLGSLGTFLKIFSQNEFLLGLTFPRIIALVVIGVFYNLFFYLFLHKKKELALRSINLLSFFQVTIDIAAITVIVYFSGGVTAIGFMFYVYPLTIAAALYRSRGITYAVILTMLLYTMVISLEFFGIIPHIESYSSSADPRTYQNHAYTFVLFVTVIFSLGVVGVFSGFISRLLQSQAEQLVTERDRVNAIIKHFPDGIILIDNNHRIIFANDRASAVMELKEGLLNNVQIIKSEFADKMEYRHLFKIFFPNERYRSPSLKQEYEIVLDDAAHTNLKILTIMVTNKNQQVIGFMKVIHDITRDKAIDRMKSEFISIAAHQLRTPLSAIKWSLKMILDGDLGKTNEEVGEFINKSYTTNERMIRLVNDLLNVSRIEEGRFVYKFSPLNLVEFITSVIQEMQHLANAQNLTIKWTPPKILIPVINADSDRLKLAFQNIIDNAIHYSNANGVISVSVVKTDDKKIKVSIKDNGIGIPKEEQKRIFVKFFRGSNVIKKQTDGSGLGLFIVKNIIEKHNATINFTSTEKGTTFNVIFPTVSDDKIDKKEDASYHRFISEF